MKNATYIAVAAVSLDGKIARHDAEMTDWTSAEDKKMMHQIEDSCDAIIVGRKTYQVAQKPLSKRNCLVLTHLVQEPVQKSENCLLFNPQYQSLPDLVGQYGYKRLCVLGGQQVYDYMLGQGLIDELYLTIEPVVFGQGISLFGEPVAEPSSKSDRHFQLQSVKQLNKAGTVLLHYTKL